jgi:hypothetical protein
MSAASLIAAQELFTAHMLPAVANASHFAFRRRFRMSRQRYEEALAECIAQAWSAWSSLIARGKDPVAIGVHGIASNAVRYVRQGRRVGNPSLGGRSAMDVYNKKSGCTVLALDDWAVGDRRWTPADEAAFRCDTTEWLASLPPRRRATAILLSEGRGTREVAELLDLTPAAISQARSWLERSWLEYQRGSVVSAQ